MRSYLGEIYASVRWNVRMLCGHSPFLYKAVSIIKNKHGVTKQDTDVVLEGFPRSGNSFFEAALRYSANDKLKIAHHTHVPANVIEGVKRGKPVVVLYRNPDDAAGSLLKIRPKFYNQYRCYKEYKRFYEKILPYEKEIMFFEMNDIIPDSRWALERLRKACLLDIDVPKHSNSYLDITRKTDELSTQRFRTTQTVYQDRFLSAPGSPENTKSKNKSIIKQFDNKTELERASCFEVYEKLKMISETPK